MPKPVRTDATYPPRVLNTGLRAIMERHDLNDNWLAMLLGVTPTTANRIKNGTDVKLTHALKISEHFKVPVNKLWSLQI